jgi:hypothetical protein
VFKTILKIVAERKKVISTKIYKILKAEWGIKFQNLELGSEWFFFQTKSYFFIYNAFGNNSSLDCQNEEKYWF